MSQFVCVVDKGPMSEFVCEVDKGPMSEFVCEADRPSDHLALDLLIPASIAADQWQKRGQSTITW